MNSREYEKLLADSFPLPPGDLDIRGRKLRAAELVPAVRGRYAPELSPSQKAVWLIATAGSRYAVNAAEYAAEFMALKPVGGEKASFAGAKSFHDAITAILSSHECAKSVFRIIFFEKPEILPRQQTHFFYAEIQFYAEGDKKTLCTARYAPKKEAETLIKNSKLIVGSFAHLVTICGAGLLTGLVLADSIATTENSWGPV